MLERLPAVLSKPSIEQRHEQVLDSNSRRHSDVRHSRSLVGPCSRACCSICSTGGSRGGGHYGVISKQPTVERRCHLVVSGWCQCKSGECRCEPACLRGGETVFIGGWRAERRSVGRLVRLARECKRPYWPYCLKDTKEPFGSLPFADLGLHRPLVWQQWKRLGTRTWTFCDQDFQLLPVVNWQGPRCK